MGHWGMEVEENPDTTRIWLQVSEPAQIAQDLEETPQGGFRHSRLQNFLFLSTSLRWGHPHEESPSFLSLGLDSPFTPKSLNLSPDR